jgi:hypothetical protein
MCPISDTDPTFDSSMGGVIEQKLTKIEAKGKDFD